jgi:hypothetical protein
VPFQEIGTHTFSHFWCLEEVRDANAFRADLAQAYKLANENGIALRSIVFPRNQYDRVFVEAAAEMGLQVFRGNEDSWIYAPSIRRKENALRRFLRLTDSYINLTGHHCFALGKAQPEMPLANVPSSRFLRPYSTRLRTFEPLKLRRITESLEHAAVHSLGYHLWWHPHNFGVHLDKNLAFLENILRKFTELQSSHGMASLTMAEAAAVGAVHASEASA